jgi:hypothetical protein
MRRYRPILSLLALCAVAVAPVASALGAAHAAGTAGMEDCHKPQKGGHCPDCDANNKCGVLCLFKCFEPAGDIRPLRAAPAFVSLHRRPASATMPLSWSRQPPAPPPRA